jgi:hypothetical protein
MQYIFVAYVYDLNAIIVCAMPTRTNAAMITAFKEVIARYLLFLDMRSYLIMGIGIPMLVHSLYIYSYIGKAPLAPKATCLH